MRKAVAKEGPCAPLFYFAAALLLAANGIAAAQTVEQSDLELCASLESSELKLECFDALTAKGGSQEKNVADVAPEPSADSATTKKTLVATGTAVSVAESATESEAAAPAAVADDNFLADPADDLGLEHADDEYADIVDEIGREHLDEKNAEDEKDAIVVRATVSEVVRGNYDVLYFHFTNGQVWRQIEGRRFRYPREGDFDVIINTGMMGEYRLRLDTGGPLTRIRRIQ